jgi:3-hydroxyisobutyrate dehydrogenase-like beta-hydroxyacid dehydrogenase
MPSGVGIVGLGLMGGAIGRNLVAAGFPVAGFDTDPQRLREAEVAGIVPCGSATEAARGRALLLTSLPETANLDMTVANLLAAPEPGLVVAELSTFPIADKERARDRLAAAGIAMLDCPLSGTGAQARTRDLAVYASGNEAVFENSRHVFEAFARVVHYLGAFGNGSRMKFVANLLVSVHNVATAEAIVLGVKSGIDPARILEVIGSGAGSSRIFELRGPMMAEGVYTPPTATMHVMQKDSAIIADYAKSLGVDTPMLRTAAPLYDEAAEQGYAAEDVGAVHAVLARRAGLR